MLTLHIYRLHDTSSNPDGAKKDMNLNFPFSLIDEYRMLYLEEQLVSNRFAKLPLVTSWCSYMRQ